MSSRTAQAELSAAPPDLKKIDDRLARIEGHVRGIRRMIRQERPCEELLLQIGAVRAALARVSTKLLEEHLEHCVARAIEEGTGRQALDDLRSALLSAGIIERS